MNYEVEISGIKAELSEVKKDVAEMKATQPFLQDMLERNTKANEKLVETLHEVELSMVAINDKLDNQQKDITSIKQEMDESNVQFGAKINKVEEKINTIDEQGKFNTRTFVRDYLPWIIVVLGAGINALAHFVSF